MTDDSGHFWQLIKDLATQRDFKKLEHFIVENSSLAKTNFYRIDKMIRSYGKGALKPRRTLWRIALRTPECQQTTVEVLECALQARDDATLVWLSNKTGKQVFSEFSRIAGSLADAKFIISDYAEAIDYYKLSLQTNAQNIKATAGLMALHASRGDYATARELAASPIHKQCPEPIRKLIGSCSGAWEDNLAQQRTVEVVIFSHATQKLRRNSHLAPPRTTLVETAIDSLRKNMNLNHTHRITVYFDNHESELDHVYHKALRQYCEKQTVDLVSNSRHGLRRQWLSAFDRAEADIVGVIEHDFEILETAPSIDQLLAIFNNRRDINYIRLNKRRNDSRKLDSALLETSGDKNDYICRTSRFSNTPHFVRRSFYTRTLRSLITNPAYDIDNGGAGGVEENINATLQQTEALIGDLGTIALIGNAIFGPIGNPPVVKHLGR